MEVVAIACLFLTTAVAARRGLVSKLRFHWLGRQRRRFEKVFTLT